MTFVSYLNESSYRAGYFLSVPNPAVGLVVVVIRAWLGGGEIRFYGCWLVMFCWRGWLDQP